MTLSVRGGARKQVLDRDDWRCIWCTAKLVEGTATIDHVIPRRDGGHGPTYNLIACCKDCNDARGYLGAVRYAFQIAKDATDLEAILTRIVGAICDQRTGEKRRTWRHRRAGTARGAPGRGPTDA